MIKARVNTILSIWIWLCHTAVPLTPWNTQWIPPSAGRQPPTPGSMGTSAIFLIISGYVWEDNIFLSTAITEMLSHRYPDAYFSHYHYHLDTHHNNNRYCIPPSLVCPLSPRNIRPAFWLSIRSENEFHAASANPVYPKTCYISPGYTFLFDFFMTFLSIRLQYIPQASGLRIRKTRMVFPGRSFFRSYIQFYQCFIIRKAWKMHPLRTEP